jgi:hypothetical protein
MRSLLVVVADEAIDLALDREKAVGHATASRPNSRSQLVERVVAVLVDEIGKPVGAEYPSLLFTSLAGTRE